MLGQKGKNAFLRNALFALGLGALAAGPTPDRVSAQRPVEIDSAQTARLRGLSLSELNRLSPHMERGPVGLVELPRGQVLPAVHIAVWVNAPSARVYELLRDPANYPRFMPAVSEVHMTERSGATRGFTWRWQSSFFSLSGDAMITAMSPPAQSAARGYRVVLTRTRGDLGRGREVWRIIPRGSRTILVASSRIDMRDANDLTRRVAGRSRSLNRSINIAMTTGALLATKFRAESTPEASGPARTTPALHAPSIQPRRFDALLRRGDLLMLELDGRRLSQSAVLTRLPQREDHVRAIMLNPRAFSEALVAGSAAEILETTERQTRFRWSLDRPIIGSSGEMTLAERADRTVELNAVDGAMRGGAWRFRTERLPSGATAVLGWAQFDVAQANFLVRAVVDTDASFRPGLTAASEIMLARALRIRARRPL